MPKDTDPSNWSRRSFLRAGISGAGALAAASLLPTSPAVRAAAPGTITPAADTPTTIGVLLPVSRAYPGLGEQFLSGLRLGFADRQDLGGGVRLLVAEIGAGGRVAAATLAGMLATESPALVVGLLGAGLTARLRPQLEAVQMPLLASSVGETIARAGMSWPLLFQHTLSQWQADWALGRWAATHVGRRAALATSFHDGGYDTLTAFRHGFEGAGGEIVRTHVTHLPPEAGSDMPLVVPLIETGPDFIYAGYSGLDAVDFIRDYARSGLAGHTPLLGTGFLTDGPVLPLTGEAGLGIITAAAWAGEMAHDAARTFQAAYRAATSRDPDPFALLGFETAMLTSAALRVAGGGATPGLLSAAMLTANIAGPRGSVTMRPGAQSTSGPVRLREVRLSDGAPTNVALAELEAIDEADDRARALSAGVRTGWLNTYLCD